MKKVIKIWAPWCGPCRSYAPTFDAFKAQNEDVEILEVNVDEDKWATARIFNVKAIPATVILLDGSYEVLMGGQTIETLNGKVNGCTKENCCEETNCSSES